MIFLFNSNPISQRFGRNQKGGEISSYPDMALVQVRWVKAKPLTRVRSGQVGLG
jgi:hypothetical protein